MRNNKELMLSALKESSDIYKRNFKKAIELMVEDVWKQKNNQALEQYQSGGGIKTFGTGAYFYDSYEGQHYAEQEKKRLKKIAHGVAIDSVVAGRSKNYQSRPKATDITTLSNSSVVKQKKPQVILYLCSPIFTSDG